MSMVSQSFRRLTLFTEKGQASACSGMMKGEAMIILEDMGQKEENTQLKINGFMRTVLMWCVYRCRWEIML